MTSPTPPNNATLDLAFKQYKLMVESAEYNSDRRERVQAFYTTIHTSLLTLLAVVAGYGLLTDGIAGRVVTIPGTNFLTQAQAPIIILVSLIGLVLCWIWGRHLGAFKRLSDAKFVAIDAIEKDLPYHPFKVEWKKLEELRHTGFTTIERIVPWVVAGIYLLFSGLYFVVTQLLTLGQH